MRIPRPFITGKNHTHPFSDNKFGCYEYRSEPQTIHLGYCLTESMLPIVLSHEYMHHILNRFIDYIADEYYDNLRDKESMPILERWIFPDWFGDIE